MTDDLHRSYDVGFIATRLSRYHEALGCEPDIRPDLTGLTIDKLPIVILALLNWGVTRFDGIVAYLDDHGATFTQNELREVIDHYSTKVRYADDSFDGLWSYRDEWSLTPRVRVLD